MKTVSINFSVKGYFFMLIDVPDDYHTPSTNPEVFWKDLKEKVGKQIKDYLSDLEDDIRYQFPSDNFEMDEMVLDQFLWVGLTGNDEKKVKTDLDFIPVNE